MPVNVEVSVLVREEVELGELEELVVPVKEGVIVELGVCESVIADVPVPELVEERVIVALAVFDAVFVGVTDTVLAALCDPVPERVDEAVEEPVAVEVDE